MDLTKDEVALIRTLGVSRVGLHIYTIFRRARLAAPAMSKALGILQRSDVVEIVDEVVSLTNKGHMLIAKQPSLLLVPPSRLQDRLNRATSSPRTSEFKGPVIGINEFYAPRTSELPRSLLKAIEDATKES